MASTKNFCKGLILSNTTAFKSSIISSVFFHVSNVKFVHSTKETSRHKNLYISKCKTFYLCGIGSVPYFRVLVFEFYIYVFILNFVYRTSEAQIQRGRFSHTNFGYGILSCLYLLCTNQSLKDLPSILALPLLVVTPCLSKLLTAQSPFSCSSTRLTFPDELDVQRARI